MTPHDIEYFSPEETEETERLAGATGELVTNWMGNNKVGSPYVPLAALAKLLATTLSAAPEEHREHATAFVIHMLLGETDVDHEAVLRTVSLLCAGAHDGGFDA